MKTIVKALALPIAAFVLASAGAVSTSTSGEQEGDAALITGYIHDPLTTSCKAVEVDCNQISGPTCMYSDGSTNWQVFRKSTDTSPCVLPLYRNQ